MVETKANIGDRSVTLIQPSFSFKKESKCYFISIFLFDRREVHMVRHGGTVRQCKRAQLRTPPT